MKILVLGATGMAGHLISLYFIEKGYEVDTFSRQPFPYGNSVYCDLDYPEQVKALVTNHYDVIINAIGILNKSCDYAPKQAIYLNSYLPHLIVDFIEGSQTKFVQMSTDCVFSGLQAPYSEDDFPDGSTLYDRTKALGEVIHNRHLTFRNSIIGPDMKSGGIGLFNWFMQQKEDVNGYRQVYWNGVTTLTLAQAMEKAIHENLTGLYHLVPDSSINKYDLLQLINKHYKGNEINIKPTDTIQLDKSLKCNRDDFSFAPPDYEKMLLEMRDWIKNHHYLYPHYQIEG